MLSLGWMEPAKVLCFCVTSFPSCVVLFPPYSCMHILLSCSGLKCSCSCAISCLGQMQELLETLLQKFFFYQMFVSFFQSHCNWSVCFHISTGWKYIAIPLLVSLFGCNCYFPLSSKEDAWLICPSKSGLTCTVLHQQGETASQIFVFQRQHVVSVQLQFPWRKMVRLLIRGCSFLPILAKNNIKQGESRVRSMQLPDTVQ